MAAQNPKTPKPPMAAKIAGTEGAEIGVVARLGGLSLAGSACGIPGGVASCLDTIVWLMHVD